MATLLFLGASVSQVPGLRHARASGHRVIACDGDPNAVGFAEVDVAAVVSFSDVDAVTEVGRRERAEGVLAVCSDRAVVPAAVVAERLGLPGIPPDVAAAMTRKSLMRARLQAAGVPQPPHVVLTASSDLRVATVVPLPAVLKPADSGGQRGLARIERYRQLPQELPRALSFSQHGEAIFEQFVEGVEVNTLFVVRGGRPTLLTISDRLRPPGAGFGVGWIHSYPSALSAATLERIESVAADAIRVLGLRDGIAFPQLIAGADGEVKLIEIAARIAAGQMADLVRYATGVELYDIAIAQALGADVPDDLIEAHALRPVVIRFLTASPGILPVGTVSAIGGLDAVRGSEGVLSANLYFDVGTTIGPLQVDADRRGYVIATGATTEDALALANAAATRLHIETTSRVKERVASPSRRLRLLAPALVAVLIVATGGVFLVTEHAKLQRGLVAATHVEKTFSPVCGCRLSVARISFRLLRRTETVVRMVNSAGHAVTTLVPLQVLGPGLVRLIWRGRNEQGVRLPDGRYFPSVDFPKLHRDLRLPSPIILDTDRPKVIAATALFGKRAVFVRYRFGEPAQAALLVDGRRAVLTRFAPLSGTLRWSRNFSDGRSLSSGRHEFSLVAIDAAGNPSRPRRLGSARFEKPTAPSAAG